MAEGQHYLTFPVCLLSNGITDIRTVTDNIMNYCAYNRACKECGTIEQRMTQAGHYFNLTWGDWKSSYDKGKLLFDQTPARSPVTSINKDIVFDFYANSKTEFEIICFLAFAGIRSILQTKPYVKITNEYLLARMAGRNTIKDVNRYHKFPKEFEKYIIKGIPNRYQMDKIKTELQNHWGLKIYARFTRGFYVSFEGKMKFEDLVFEVEKRRKSNIEKLRKTEQQQAVNKALNKIFKTTP